MRPVALILFLAAIILFGGKFFGRKDPAEKFVIKDTTPIIRVNDPKNYSGAITVNVDDDPEAEILIGGNGTSNLILKRVNGELHPLMIPELEDPHGLTHALSACDLDRDGRDEIFLLNRKKEASPSVPRILRYEKGKWSDVLPSTHPLIPLLKNGTDVTCVDRKGDGQYGLVIVSENSPLIYLERIGGEFKNTAHDLRMSVSSDARSVIGVPGPDGATDIFIGTSADNLFYQNDGKGNFLERAKELGITDPRFKTSGAGPIDLNHDEVPDLIYGNYLGPLRIFLQDRRGHFTDKTPEIMRSNYAVNSAVAADFNLDGDEDIYLNNIRNENALFARNEDEWFPIDIGDYDEHDMYGVSTLVGDLDGRPGLEILNTHGDGTSFPLKLYSVDPAGNWLSVKVRLSNGGVPRGSVVKLKSDKREQVRVISTGSGRYANYGDEIFFGLKEGESAVGLEVLLPSGKRISFKGPFQSPAELVVP